MDIKRVAAAQEYEDFVLTLMMVKEKDYDTLLFNLSGEFFSIFCPVAVMP